MFFSFTRGLNSSFTRVYKKTFILYIVSLYIRNILVISNESVACGLYIRKCRFLPRLGAKSYTFCSPRRTFFLFRAGPLNKTLTLWNLSLALYSDIEIWKDMVYFDFSARLLKDFRYTPPPSFPCESEKGGFMKILNEWLEFPGL